jgi:RDD family protein
VRIDEPAPAPDPTDKPPRRPRAGLAAPGSVVPAQARTVQGRRAGIVSRAIADMVDCAVVVGVLAAGYLGVVTARFLWRSWAFTLPTPSFLLMLVLGGVTAVIYLTAAWGTTGRSYGKHLMGLRVLGPFGRLRFGGAFLRAVLCVVLPIGIVWVAVSRHNRSLQDVVLRTSVVYDWLGGTEEGTEEEERVHPPGRTAEPDDRRSMGT